MLGLRAISEAPIGALLDAQVTVTQHVTFRFATQSFATKTTDTPANEFIDGRLGRGLTLARRLTEVNGQFGALIETQFGEIELVNIDGVLDNLATMYFADGQPIRLLMGRTEVDQFGNEKVRPYTTFELVYSSVAGEWTFERNVLRLRIRDLSSRLNDRLQSLTYSGLGGKDGTSSMAGRTRPTAFGRVQNISAQLVDPNILTYQVHAGDVEEIIDVFDAGISLPFSADYVDYATLEAAVIPSGSYATCLAEGYFRLGSAPFGMVTATIRGHKDNISGNHVSQHGSVLRTILRDYGSFTAADIDNASFNRFNANRPGTIGLFLPAGDQSTILEVIERIAFSAGAFIGQDRSGRMRLQHLEMTALPHWVFDDRNIISIERVSLPYRVPWKAWGVGYNVNWTVQDNAQLAAGVSQSRRQFLESERRYAYVQSSEIALSHSTSAGITRDTLLIDGALAAEEAQRLMDFYGLGRTLYRAVVKDVLFEVELGQMARLVYDRWDLAGGKNFIVVGIEDNADTVETELLLFGSGVQLPATNVLWAETPTAAQVGTSFSSYVATFFAAVATDEVTNASIANAPDASPSLRAHFGIGDNYGINVVCEQLVPLALGYRGSVSLKYQVYLDPAVNYLAVCTLPSQTFGFLTFPGLVGGQLWPGPNDHAYPTGGEPMEGDNWSARIRVAGSGKIAPYLYVQNKPGEFGWLRLSDHPLRINDLRGAWATFEQICVMNTPGLADGRCVLKINDDTIVDVSDVMYRSTGFDEVVANGIRLQSHVQGTDGAPATAAFDYWMREFSIEYAP